MNGSGEYSIAAQVWALRKYGEVGPRTFRVLMAKFGQLEAIHKAEIEDLIAIEGLGEKRSRKIFESSDYLDQAKAFIDSLDSQNARYSTRFDEAYPVLFEELNDPPPIIFYRGKLPQEGEKTAAIVGSHEATGEGINYAVQLATRLAENDVSIVSGLARGIDSAGHIGALKTDAPTYAVLGSGFDNIFPEENRLLAKGIEEQGALISEYPPDARASAGRLMARNRLIVGLSQAVIIGEVLPDSTGTLDTAASCHQLGKLMFVLINGYERPGSDNSTVEKILNQGAIPVSLEDGIDIIVKSLV